MTSRPSPSLGGRRVVVCRARAQAAALVDAIENLGAVGLALPLLEPADPNDGGAALSRALAALETFDWVVLTSSNAVHAVASRVHLPDAVRLAVVGPATARAAHEAGWTPAFVPTIATAESLATELPIEATSSVRVLAPLAELAADTIERVLAARGAVVERVEAYRMATPPHSVDDITAALGADVVLLTSPSTAERFAALREEPGVAPRTRALPKAIAIGPSTAEAATAAGFDVIATADPHTEEGLLAALVRTIGA